MRYKTIACVATLAISSAALAQMTTRPGQTPSNNMAMQNSMGPGNMTMPMNTQDETMMNDMSMPDTATPNSTMTPR